MKPVFLFFGILFGFLLSRAGATTFDFHAQLFLLENLQLLWVIVSAVAVGVAGIFIMKRLRVRSLMGKEPLTFEGKAMRPQLVSGALLLGIGWGLTGSCPGTAPVMLGEGKLAAVFTVVGIVAGTYLYGLVRERMRQARGATLASAVSTD
jgi:uncharacterized membrane protein YedE/YeeE